jgi:hypothetical protein
MVISDKFKLSGIFLIFLFFGVIGEGFGQVTRQCIQQVQCQPNASQGQITATDFRLEDEQGNVIDVENCDNISGQIYVSFEYTSNNLTNVFFISNLRIIRNSDNVQIDVVEFDYPIGNLANTPGNQTRRFRHPVTLPENYDCKSHRLVLTDIDIRWTQPNRAATCENYQQSPGRCRRNFGENDIRVDGFLYGLNYDIGCFEEDGSVSVNFFVNIAGGSRPYTINWSAQINGDEPISRTGGGIFPVILRSPDDVVTASVVVTDSQNRGMNPAPGSVTPEIPEIFVSPEFLKKENVEDENPPNGSITLIDWDLFSDLQDIDEIQRRFTFNWVREGFDNFEIDDPTNLQNLEGGLYRLTLFDNETGLCRVFDFIINSIPTPVIYSNLSLNFNPSTRTVNFYWSTTKEWEASHYEVQRAVRGTQFEKIGEVKASGWSDQLREYRFEDKFLPLTGGNLLYRLKQVDFNGDFEYSKVLSIRVPGIQFTQGVWRVFPNPTDGSLLRVSLLDRSQYQDEAITFRLIHPFVQTAPLTVDTEAAMNEAVGPLLDSMPNGVFVLEIQWGQRIEHIKVIKKD